MTRKGRMWTGATLLVIIALNYAIIGFPLIKKSESVKEKAKMILVRQVPSGSAAGRERSWVSQS